MYLERGHSQVHQNSVNASIEMVAHIMMGHQFRHISSLSENRFVFRVARTFSCLKFPSSSCTESDDRSLAADFRVRSAD